MDVVVYINIALSCDGNADISISDFEFEPGFAGFGSETLMYTAYRIDFEFNKLHDNKFVVIKIIN